MNPADPPPPLSLGPPPPARPRQAIVGGLPWERAEPLVGAPQLAPLLPETSQPPSRITAERQPPVSWRERAEAWLDRSPAWTLSLSLHLIVLLALAMFVVREPKPKRLRLDIVFATEESGDAPIAGVIIAPEPVAAPEDEPVDEVTPEPAVAAVKPPEEEPEEKPLQAFVLPPVEPVEDGAGPVAAAAPPSVRSALAGREAGRREALLAASGGGGPTEAAVALALEWLAKQQDRKDGLWSLQGPYLDGSKQENRLAATVMALLAFQGAGNTTSEGPYREAISRAWKTLGKRQAADGSFDLGSIPDQHAMYAHAQATIAVCELYGMTKDESLRPAAQRALGYALAAQMPDGGWRYRPPEPNGDNKGDMSVTGWFMMALKSGEMAGLDVPAEAYHRLGRFLDAVFISDDKGYGYQIIPNQKVVQVRPALTAEALLCRQYLGAHRDDPRLLAGVNLLSRELPLDFDYPHKNVYAWYYATQVCHHMQGAAWQEWNERMREMLPTNQVGKGKERGSWDPANDQWGHFGGRLFMTCLCTYMLEVYYRHLPLYSLE